MSETVIPTGRLSDRLAAIASPQRMHIVAALAGERLHVSELARRVGMSRALLYMHLNKLEEAGFVTGELALSEDGKALKYFDAVPFTLTIDLPAIVAAVEDRPGSTPGDVPDNPTDSPTDRVPQTASPTDNPTDSPTDNPERE